MIGFLHGHRNNGTEHSPRGVKSLRGKGDHGHMVLWCRIGDWLWYLKVRVSIVLQYRKVLVFIYKYILILYYKLIYIILYIKFTIFDIRILCTHNAAMYCKAVQKSLAVQYWEKWLEKKIIYHIIGKKDHILFVCIETQCILYY